MEGGQIEPCLLTLFTGLFPFLSFFTLEKSASIQLGTSPPKFDDTNRPLPRVHDSWVPLWALLSKEWIEILKFWIQFFTNFGNFTDFSSKFCKISGVFNKFRHFGTCSRNPDKISSKFRWEIAFFMKKSEISIENSIFNLAKLWLIFFVKFWGLSGAKVC